MTLSFVLSLAFLMAAQTPQVSSAERPQETSYCDLVKGHAQFDKKLVRIRAFVTHGFENFQLADPDCPTPELTPDIWLMFGGGEPSGVVYCCPGEGPKETRSNNIIKGIAVPLHHDSMLERFRGLLSKERDTVIYATLVGRFFAGEGDYRRRQSWRGFGHMGCCNLFVIERVEDFEAHDSPDFDYTSEGGWYEDLGCKWGSLRWVRHISVNRFQDAAQALREQEAAHNGARSWAFVDAERVARESLLPHYDVKDLRLKRVRSAASRQVFRGVRGKDTVLVVVTRPYWLSLYDESKRVPWIATMIKEGRCN